MRYIIGSFFLLNLFSCSNQYNIGEIHQGDKVYFTNPKPAIVDLGTTNPNEKWESWFKEACKSGALRYQPYKYLPSEKINNLDCPKPKPAQNADGL